MDVGVGVGVSIAHAVDENASKAVTTIILVEDDDSAGSGQRVYGENYSWSHGNCMHTSAECVIRAEGHNSNANFTNMQRNVTSNCL